MFNKAIKVMALHRTALSGRRLWLALGIYETEYCFSCSGIIDPS